MFDRRGFLKTSCSLAAISGTGPVSSSPPSGMTISSTTAEQGVYHQMLASSSDLQFLGLPRDRSQVQEGLHPFSPARVLILTQAACRQLSRKSGPTRKRVWERTEKDRLGDNPEWLALPDEKFDVVMTLADRFTSYYKRPDLFEKWAMNLVQREALCTSGMGDGHGLVHQFQHEDVSIATDNGLVDWWLVLCPDGVNYDCLDGEPAYVLCSHIFDRRNHDFEIGVWDLSAMLRFFLLYQHEHAGSHLAPYLKEIANLNPVTAARLLNYQLASYLQDLQNARVKLDSSR